MVSLLNASLFFFEIVALYYWLVDTGVPMFFLKYHKGGTWEEKRKEGKNFSDINVLIKLCVCVFFKRNMTQESKLNLILLILNLQV